MRGGQVLHDDLHRRDSSADGLVGLAPDRIDWDSSTVMENKSSASAFEASADQTAFYAILLSAATGRVWSGSVYVAKSRRHKAVDLNEDRLTRMEAAIEAISVLDSQESDRKRTRLNSRH